MKRSTFIALIISLVLLIDQWSKIWVKLNMKLGDYFEVLDLDWFRIQFIENPGMAFGLELGFFGDYAKLILTLFRIVVVSGIAYMIIQMVKKEVSYLLLATVALIFAGAIGNIIDCVCYGLIFSDSGTLHNPELASFLPAEGGYTSIFNGKVVDMLYFPLYEGHFPTWLPFWGGDYFQFFQPIFNVADTAISIGVGMAILFYKRFQKEVEDLEAASQQSEPKKA